MHWRLRTAAMFVAMTGILVVLGSVVGKLLGNWIMGLLAMLAVSVVFCFYSYFL